MLHLRRAQALWSIRDYVSNTAGGNDGQHAPLAGWFWWCWNANSGDTGGLVRKVFQLSGPTKLTVSCLLAVSCAMSCWHYIVSLSGHVMLTTLSPLYDLTRWGCTAPAGG